MSVPEPGTQTPRFRTVSAVIFVALLAFAAAAMFIINRTSLGVFGWNVGADGTTVISVTPGYPVDKAGIRPGDRIDFAHLSLMGRVNTILTQAVYDGAPLTVRFTHNGQKREAQIRAAYTPFEVAGWTGFGAGALLLAVGIGLVLLRPSRMTWGFLLIGVAPIMAGFDAPYRSDKLYLGAVAAVFLGTAIGWAGLLTFASRFPTDEPKGWLRLVDRAAVPMAVLFAIAVAYIALDLLFASQPPAYAALVVVDYLFPAIASILAMAALLNTALAYPGSIRQRLIPVIVSLGLWIALNAISVIASELYTTPMVIYILPFCSGVAMALFAIAVAYGVIRHRVIDVSFIVSRTVVYTILTAILVGVFALIDFLASKWLERSQLALVLEVGAALAMGFWLNTMHGRVDRFVDSVLFRRRHLAEKRLARVAKMLPHATSAEFVDESLVVEPGAALELASSALFRRISDGNFTRCFASGWNNGSATCIDASDRLVVQLEAELDAVNLSDVRWPRSDIPTGLHQPLLAVPFVIRHQLEAFALYGGHIGGEALDPDEIRCLRELATPAASAYDHLKAEDLRKQLELLRAANEELQREQQTNVGLMDLMRRQTAGIEELLRRRPSTD
jgi:hypothetical protein